MTRMRKAGRGYVWWPALLLVPAGLAVLAAWLAASGLEVWVLPGSFCA